MADSKVSALTAATSVGGSDQLYLIQSSASKSVTADVLYSSISNPTITGNVVIGDTRQNLNSPGVISNILPVTLLTVGGTDGVLSIHPGVEDGQVKIILTTAAAGGTYYINRANIAGNANVQFDTIGDTATLMYQGNDWFMIGGTANVVAT
jgi:hypothetical protein